MFLRDGLATLVWEWMGPWRTGVVVIVLMGVSFAMGRCTANTSAGARTVPADVCRAVCAAERAEGRSEQQKACMAEAAGRVRRVERDVDAWMSKYRRIQDAGGVPERAPPSDTLEESVRRIREMLHGPVRRAP